MITISRAASSAETQIHRLSRWIRFASLAALFIMMFFVAADVFGRYILKKPIRGDMDLQEMMMVLVVFLALPYCTSLKGNIHVELLVNRLSGLRLAIVKSIGSLISLTIIVLIAWQIWVFGWRELLSLSARTTMLIHIPLGPFIIIAAIGYTIMALELLIDFVHCLSQVKNVMSGHLPSVGIKVGGKE